MYRRFKGDACDSRLWRIGRLGYRAGVCAAERLRLRLPGFEVPKDEVKDAKFEKAEKNELKELKGDKFEKENIKREKNEKREKSEIKEIKAEKIENDGVFDPGRIIPGPDPRFEQLIQAVSGLTKQVTELSNQVEELKKKG